MALNRDKKTQSEVQAEARKIFKEKGYRAGIAMCTGAGKSKIGVDEAYDARIEEPNCNIMLMVPTTKLKNENWPDEFRKWGHEEILDNNFDISCYVSAQKYVGKKYKLAILDEGHHITENSMEFFINNEVERVLLLTATPPTDSLKKEIINIISPISFVYKLEEGVYDGFITPFEIHVIHTQLDEKDKYIKGGNAKKTFFQTEASKYKYVEDTFQKRKETYLPLENKMSQIETELRKAKEHSNTSSEFSFKEEQIKRKYNFEDLEKQYKLQKMLYNKVVFERLHFIYGLKSKTEAAKTIFDKLYKKDRRYLLFCGSIKQADELCGKNVYHSKVKDTAFTAFKNKEINYLGAVKSLNEGHNIPELDEAIIVQFNSSEKDIIQQIGRLVRFREGHKAKIFLLCCDGTKDEAWLSSSLKTFNDSLITHWDYQTFLDQYDFNQ